MTTDHKQNNKFRHLFLTSLLALSATVTISAQGTKDERTGD